MPAKPTAKQAKALELIREGKSPRSAMLASGYTKATAAHPSENLLRTPGATSIIEQYKDAYSRLGITPQFMAAKTEEWLKAQKYDHSITEPDKLVPDYQTQLKAAEMVRKDWGMAQEAGISFNAGEMTVNFRPAPKDGLRPT